MFQFYRKCIKYPIEINAYNFTNIFLPRVNVENAAEKGDSNFHQESKDSFVRRFPITIH